MSLEDFCSGGSDYDSETELQDLQQLNAVLNSEAQSPVASTSKAQFSTASSSGSSSKVADEIAKIETAISLNKLMEEKLRKLEKILQERLQECDQRLEDMNDSKGNRFFDKEESFSYIICGKPYFKDKANFTPPNNEDTITMQNSGMYDFSTIISVCGWTVKDKSLFLLTIQNMSQEIRIKQIETQISELKRKAKINQNISMGKKIKLLEKEIGNIYKKTLKDIALPITEDYDWEHVANKLNCRHSATEYQALWKLFLHPSINKNCWSKSEHTSLQKIAATNKFQDWDDIANKLGTNRTGYQCFVYFRTNMSNTFTGKKWTKEEEEYLKRLIDFYREGNYIPWGKVATTMENRTKVQIYNKYNRLIELRKGRFLPEEDAVILTCADNFGTNFRRMASYLPGRSSAQIRVRYQILSKNRVSTVWTAEEDNKLIKLLANHESPAVFSTLSKYFPGKDRMNIRSRYLTLAKWMKTHPDIDISKAPRRASRRLGHGRPLDNLNKAIENLKQRIKNEVEERKCKKVTKDSPDHVIDDAIMAVLATQIAKDEEAKALQEYECEQLELPDDTTVSSKTLNATNLRKLLIFLKSVLNKTKLAESEYCKQYPDLLKGENEVSLVKVKSYSKKDAIRTVVKKNPDVFGVNRLKNLNYVLPPHYATITGCRQLMALISNTKIRTECDFDLNVLLRRNPLLKTHFTLLLERFNALFLWPMLLSNHPPILDKDDNERNHISKPNTESNEHMFKIGIAIPETRTNVINHPIDLNESDVSEDQINLTVTFLEGNVRH